MHQSIIAFVRHLSLKAIVIGLALLATLSAAIAGLFLNSGLVSLHLGQRSASASGTLLVSAQLPPPNATGVPPTATITLVFDRPVVPLSQVQKSTVSKAKVPITITPRTDGRWRWLGTTTVQFVPSSPLALATAYSVNVPAGMETISGHITATEYSWTFETARPVLLGSDPAEGSEAAGPTTAFALRFNQEMNLTTAKDFVKIREKTKGGQPTAVSSEIPVKMITYGVKEDENGKKVKDLTSLSVLPAVPYKFNSDYSITVLDGIRGMQGSLGSSGASVVNFSTVGPLGAAATYDGNYLSVVFTNSINDATLSGNIIITPPIDGLADALATQEWSEHKKLDPYVEMKPSTRYTLIVKTGIADIHGQHPAKDYRYSWTTPPITPSIFIHPRGRFFSIFEQGKTPEYFLNTVNTTGLDIKLGELPVSTFLRLRQETKTSSMGIDAIDIEKSAENIKRWHVEPKKLRDIWESIPFDLEKKFGSALKPGLYVFGLSSKETPEEQKIFAVTNMGLTLKYSGNRVLAWVTDLQTGSPIADASVELKTLDEKTSVSGKTNKEGIFESTIDIAGLVAGQVNAWQPEFWIMARKGDDFTFVGSDWNQGSAPYDFSGIYQDMRTPQSAPVRLLSTVYTERPIYKVGDTVSFKGITRFLDWNGLMNIPASKSVVVTVNDPNGKQIYGKTLKIGDFGSFSDTLPIDADAPLGYYSISGKIIPEADTGQQTLYGGFQVFAYRKPEYRVSVTPETIDYFGGQTVKAGIAASYYFGAPMDGARVEWRVISSDYYFNKFTDGWYSFALDDSWCWGNCSMNSNIVTQGKDTLDATGKLSIQFPTNIDDKTVSQIFSIEADITDKNNQVVSSRSDVFVHKSKVYVGIKTDDYVVSIGEKAGLSLVTVDTNGKPVPNQKVTLDLYSRVWNTVKQKGVDGEYYEDNQPVDTLVRTSTVRSDEKGKASAQILLEQGGQFRVVATVTDSDGRKTKAGTSLYAWSKTFVNWPRSNNDRLDIVADRPTYNVGDTAKLLIKTPFQGKGVKALVTVERENVISHRIIDVLSNALPIEIPITDDLLPTAYVSVVIQKPRIGETFNENGLDTGAPSFKIGYVKLPINTAPKKLSIGIETNKEKYLPGETVTATLTTRDADGKPVPAELSLGAVDLSLLELAGFQMPDLVSTFYWDRGLGVVSANMLTYLEERFKPGSKGGDGSDGEKKARGTFRDTAFWQSTIVTDANGKAVVTFALPDNLTTWHLLAIGSTKKHAFGAEAKTIIETKRVILRSVRPRFAVIGDRVRLGAIVHNYLQEKKTFTVTLDGSGFSQNGDAKQTVTIEKEGNVKVHFPVTMQDTGSVLLHFKAATDGAQDELSETIPLFRYGVEQTNALSGLTDDSQTELVSVPTKKEATEGLLSVSVAPSIAVYLGPGLEYLANYPYGCTEQIVSSFLPNVILKKLQGFDAFRIVSDAVLEKNVLAGLQKITAYQHPSGGFGYWQHDDRTYPGLTAYVLSALTLTRNAGYSVDASVVDGARSYLQAALRSVDQSGEISDPATRAAILFALSEDGTTDVSLLNNLLKKQANLPIYARAYLAMAFEKAGTIPAKKSAKALVKDLLSHAQIDSRGAEFQEEAAANGGISMNTNDRTTALALLALLRIDPENVIIPKVMRGLLEARQNGHWDTTQSTSMALQALIAYMQHTNELERDFKATVMLNDKNILTHAYAKGKPLSSAVKIIPFSDLERGKTASVQFEKKGKGKLYYDMALSYFFAPDEIEPLEEGIGILRDIEPMQKSQKSMQVGKTFKVTLTVTVPRTRHFVGIESPLPAGMEAIDLSQATAQQGLYQQAVNQSDSPWESPISAFTHREFRDDRVFLFADELVPGVYTYEYLVRATTSGTFRLRPAKAWEMYLPETFGQTKGEWITITE